MTMLTIENLSIEFLARQGAVKTLEDVSLTLSPGEVVGLVGESGAGKSLTGAAVLGLLPTNAKISGGAIRFGSERLDVMSERGLRKFRGKKVGAVFQNPMTSLDPLMTIGEQIIETIICHFPISRMKAQKRAAELLQSVGVPAAEERLNAYPHEFSGGMRQRVVIALALAGEPEVIIADEPTTALDVSVQAQILALLKKLCKERKTAVILITHDMGVIAQTADRVVVLYAGGIVEMGPVEAIISSPAHPYTQGLMAAVPEIGGPRGDILQINGNMPRPGSWPTGCRFAPRCQLACEACNAVQMPVEVGMDHFSNCHRALTLSQEKPS